MVLVQDVPEFLANHSNLEGVILNCERGAAKMESSLGMEVTTMAHLRALVYQGWPGKLPTKENWIL